MPEVDLSGFRNLTELSINFCRKSDFVITKLPTTLQRLDISGLAEFNVRLTDEDNGFGRAVEDVSVYNPAMCCNTTMYRMFSMDLSDVCQSSFTEKCGIYLNVNHYDSSVTVSLSVDDRQLLYRNYTGVARVFTEEPTCDADDVISFGYCEKQLSLNQSDYCYVSILSAAGPDMFLTQEDIDVLSRCPLKQMVLPYTACFSGPVDLTGLSHLHTLSIAHCTQLDFTITGLPPELENLDIRGLNIDNIQLTHGASSGGSLRQIEVSDPTHCKCPQAFYSMFGKSLPADATCGLTDTIYSSLYRGLKSTYRYDGLDTQIVGYQTDGFDSAISSCEYLIADPVLRIILWTMAVFATAGNFAVIVYRAVWDRGSLQKSHGIYPFNLAVSDLLMGVYLIIITEADTRFRGEYVLQDQEWRTGFMCHLAGFLSTVSSETSAILIFLITVDRFLAIQFPFGQHRISTSHTWQLCAAVWLTGVCIASVPLLVSDWQVYSFNSICVGLPLNTDVYPGSGYATGIFIGVNSVLFLLIAVGQAAIYRAMWVNSKQMTLNEEQAKRRYKRDMAVARQLSLIVITDFLCWFPICIMGLMAQNGQVIPDVAYAWSAVLILPINSSINPLLYTLRHVVNDVIRRCHKGRNDVTNMSSTRQTSTS